MRSSSVTSAFEPSDAKQNAPKLVYNQSVLGRNRPKINGKMKGKSMGKLENQWENWKIDGKSHCGKRTGEQWNPRVLALYCAGVDRKSA